jgi:LDH2 family malate/lactate/ureidoglycolate dehydrogenase
MMALPEDMIGISMTIGGKGMVVPGSVGQGATINVLSVAVPSEKEAPFVLDMATTVVAHGKIEIAAREGKSLRSAGRSIAGQSVTTRRNTSERSACCRGGSRRQAVTRDWDGRR